MRFHSHFLIFWKKLSKFFISNYVILNFQDAQLRVSAVLADERVPPSDELV